MFLRLKLHIFAFRLEALKISTTTSMGSPKVKISHRPNGLASHNSFHNDWFANSRRQVLRGCMLIMADAIIASPIPIPEQLLRDLSRDLNGIVPNFADTEATLGVK